MSSEISTKEMGLTLSESFYDEGRTKPQSRGYVDSAGNKTGGWTYWYDNGHCRAKGSHNVNGNRTGVWTEWHENGNFRATGRYNDGYPEGEWTYGYENGSLEFKSYYNAGIFLCPTL